MSILESTTDLPDPGESAGDRAVAANRFSGAIRRRVMLAALGGIFILNSVLLRHLGLFTDNASLVDWASDDGVLSGIIAGVGLVIILVGVADIVLRNLRGGNMSLNTLVVLAILASVVRANREADGVTALQTAGAIAFFLLLTLIIESQSAVGARASLEALAKLTPGRARRLCADGSDEDVEPQFLAPADRIVVRPGETVHADGVIRRGLSALQEANITGEALPVDKQPGDTVFAGTMNMSGLIEVEVTRAGKDTTLGKVRDLILSAEESRLPFVRLIDTYVRYYTPVVLMIALLVWLSTNDLGRIAALLVAACPIALILATPSAMIAALSAAARLGVLIKNVNDIEAMAKADAFILDKTGTVTKGELGVVKLAPAPGVKPGRLVTMAAGAEANSNHPVAIAVRRLAEKSRVKWPEPEQLHEEPGHGMRATFANETVCIGNLKWMERNGLAASDFPEHANMAGESMLYVMADDKPLGWIALQDQIRDGAVEFIEELKELNVRHVALVTGDRTGVATRVAAELKIEHVRGDCVPSEKVDYVEAMKAQGLRPVFVGDGVNDGPALAASHLGIAMGAAGSDVAVETASIALLNNRLDRLPFLVRLSRQAHAVILQNFLIGGIFIFGGMALGAAGKLNISGGSDLGPLYAAIIQVVSALAVVLNSARLVRAGEELS